MTRPDHAYEPYQPADGSPSACCARPNCNHDEGDHPVPEGPLIGGSPAVPQSVGPWHVSPRSPESPPEWRPIHHPVLDEWQNQRLYALTEVSTIKASTAFVSSKGLDPMDLLVLANWVVDGSPAAQVEPVDPHAVTVTVGGHTEPAHGAGCAETLEVSCHRWDAGEGRWVRANDWLDLPGNNPDLPDNWLSDARCAWCTEPVPVDGGGGWQRRRDNLWRPSCGAVDATHEHEEWWWAFTPADGTEWWTGASLSCWQVGEVDSPTQRHSKCHRTLRDHTESERSRQRDGYVTLICPPQWVATGEEPS